MSFVAYSRACYLFATLNFTTSKLSLPVLINLCAPIARYVYTKENIRVNVNGTYMSEEHFAQGIDGKLYVSARGVADLMGLTLEWSGYESALRFKGYGKNLSMIVATNFVIVDNVAVDVAEPLKLISDRSVVDIGLLCEVFGAKMELVVC